MDSEFAVWKIKSVYIYIYIYINFWLTENTFIRSTKTFDFEFIYVDWIMHRVR
jgi:hypothetical protein